MRILPLIYILCSGSLYAAEPLFPLLLPGGIGSPQLIDDTFDDLDKDILQPLFPLPNSLLKKNAGLGISANMYFSEDYNIYTIPLRYRGLKYWTFSCSFPFVFASSDEEPEYFLFGMGDITLGACFSFPEFLRGLTVALSVDISLPTGKVDAVDNNQNIPLGSGSTLSFFQLSLSWERRKLRIFAEGGFGFYWYKSDYSVVLYSIPTRYITEKGMSVSGLAGVELQLFRKIKVFTKVYLGMNTESQVEEQTLLGTVSYGADDSLLAADLQLGFKTNLLRNLSFSFTVALPIYTRYDKDVEDQDPRDIGIKAGISTRF